MQRTSYANRGGMRIYRPWQKIPYHREYEDVLAEHSHRLWPESMPTCFQAVPISSLTEDPTTQEEIFKKCYPKASMEPACFKIIDPIASEATAQAAVLEQEEPRIKEHVEPRSKELEAPEHKELEERKSKTLVDVHGVIKPFDSIMTEYKKPKQSKQSPTTALRLKLHATTPKKLHSNTTGSNMRLNKLHPYNFKPVDTTMRSDPIRGRIKPADPTRKLYNGGSIVPVKPAYLKSKVINPAPMRTDDEPQGKVKPADPTRKMYTDGSIVPVKSAHLKSEMLKPATMRTDGALRGKVKAADPKLYSHKLIVPVRPTDQQSKLLKPAMMRPDMIRGKVKSAYPNLYNGLIPVKLAIDMKSKALKPAMMRSDPIPGKPAMMRSDPIPGKPAMMRSGPIPGKVKQEDPTRKKMYDGLIVPVKAADSMSKQHRGTAKLVDKLYPYNFKPTNAIRCDTIQGKLKPADPTKKLYNHGMIVPVKPVVQRPKMHIDQAKIADLRLKLHKDKAKHSKPTDASLKHIPVPRFQLYNSTSTSTTAINLADRRLDRKRKYEPITTSPDNHIVKKRI